LDVLRLPVIGAFVRWRYSRFALQVPLLLLAALAVYDGFTGRQIAPLNTATVSVWVHYRGLVALAIALVGNLFCAACPLMLTRGPTKFLKRFVPEFQFPRALRNKYLVLGLTLIFLYSYEHFDLWASPWLTAWLILAYFAAALLVDAFFPVGSFCKYVCPLGNFNFALASSAPTQITAVNSNVCDTCEGKYCLNGRVETATTRAPITGHRSDHVLLELPMASAPSSQGRFPGCETDLFVPALHSNADCTLCLNCVRACPYDNVALTVRSPALEPATVRPVTAWAWFVVVLAWAGLVNAFAMVPSFFATATWLSGVLGTRDEALLLFIIQGVGIGAGVGLTWLAARGRVRDWVGVLMPLAIAVWGGHYLFHFVTGYNTLVPNMMAALERLGLPVTVPPMPGVVRGDGIFPVQAVISYAALLLSFWVAWQRARALQPRGETRDVILAMLPMIVLAIVFNALTLLIFAQPMQARGSLLQ
jgi:polyferredoxin